MSTTGTTPRTPQAASAHGLLSRRGVRPLLGWVVPVVLVALWFLLTNPAAPIVPAYKLPSPEAVITAGVDLAQRGELWQFIAISVQRVVIGFTVGALLGIKRANIGPLLEELEKRGLIRREASVADRRSQALYLTEPGRDLLAELHRREAGHEALIATHMTGDERMLLLDLLGRVERACRDVEEEGVEGEDEPRSS